MVEQFYRFVSGSVGVYEAVDRDCPKNDSLRSGKPDGSWLPKVGPKFPGAISFWTEFGLNTYMQSGLLNWHRSVVKIPIQVRIVQKPTNILYQDKFQIICAEEPITIIQELGVGELILMKSDEAT